jgi:uncharacterized protein YlxW (UPF0749 family)
VPNKLPVKKAWTWSKKRKRNNIPFMSNAMTKTLLREESQRADQLSKENVELRKRVSSLEKKITLMAKEVKQLRDPRRQADAIKRLREENAQLRSEKGAQDVFYQSQITRLMAKVETLIKK